MTKLYLNLIKSLKNEMKLNEVFENKEEACLKNIFMRMR